MNIKEISSTLAAATSYIIRGLLIVLIINMLLPFSLAAVTGIALGLACGYPIYDAILLASIIDMWIITPLINLIIYKEYPFDINDKPNKKARQSAGERSLDIACNVTNVIFDRIEGRLSGCNDTNRGLFF